MTWTVEFDDAAAKELRKLDRQAQHEILRYLRERIATDEDRLGLVSHCPVNSQGSGATVFVITI